MSGIRKNRLIIVLVFFLFSLSVQGQDSRALDSLNRLLRSNTPDSVRISAFLETGYIYEANDPFLSLMYYDSAQVYSIKNLPGLQMNQLKKFLSESKPKEKHREFRTYLQLLSQSVRYKGIVNYFQGNLPASLAQYQQSLIIAEFLGNETDIAKCLTNIGLVQQSMQNLPLALEYYTKALEYNRQLNDTEGLLNTLNQMGALSIALGDYKKGLAYCEEALKVSQQLNNLIEKSVCLGNMGTIYKHLKQYDKALEKYQEALDVDRIMNDSLNISVSYNHIGMIYKMKEDYAKAAEYSELSLKIAQNIGYKDAIKYASMNLIEVYAKMGNYRKCYDYFGIYTDVKDSIYNEQSMRLLHEMEATYQTEKKQLLIEKLNKEKELQQSELLRQEERAQRQNLIILFIVSGLILISLFAFFVVQRLRITRRQKRIIENQKRVVDEKNLILNQQNEEIRAQRDEIEAQRDHIREIHNSMTDSINYARRIQSALLPELSQMFDVHSTVVKDHFLLYRPKDIVSGDFYWCTQTGNYLVLVVADCTGHGVPGAFMSMLGVSFLNEIVRKKEVVKAGEVLDHLRDSVIDSLKQNDRVMAMRNGDLSAVMGVNDGMDIIVCVIDTNDLTLRYAGANNSLIIVSADKELTVLPADKQPVAIYLRMSPFSETLYQLKNGDCLYLMSDGYEDQFGGPRNTKFMNKKLRELLRSISDHTMAVQKEILEKSFDDWKGSEEQIDDVTILGIKINHSL